MTFLSKLKSRKVFEVARSAPTEGADYLVLAVMLPPQAESA
jgi:hypothetical protein